MTTKVLGVNINDISQNQAVEEICNWISSKNKAKHYVVTVGPEFLVTASHHEEFRAILNSADMSVPDGVGLKLAGVKNTVPGVELMEELCSKVFEQGWTIGLLGGQEGVAQHTKDILSQKFPGVKINFALDGAEADSFIGRVYSNQQIQKLECDIFFVNLGHPKQEKFIHELMNDGSPIRFKVAMGVGGSFDLISGNLPIPPMEFRLLGLGWLYRLFTEKPGMRISRAKRIINALVVYPWLLFTARI